MISCERCGKSFDYVNLRYMGVIETSVFIGGWDSFFLCDRCSLAFVKWWNTKAVFKKRIKECTE